MRGLSERAPQFLRDCGEEGVSRHARLQFLPTGGERVTGAAEGATFSMLGASCFSDHVTQFGVWWYVVC